MKRLITVMFMSLMISVSTYQNCTANLRTSNEQSSKMNYVKTLEDIKVIKTQLKFDIEKAYRLKNNKEKDEAFTNLINYQLIIIDNIRNDLFDVIDNTSIIDKDNEIALRIVIGIGYYKIAYQELQEYISNQNTNLNFESLDRISYDVSAGESTLSNVENQLNR